MKKFELWLDESGDFENDAKRTGTNELPSLVGGLLIENRSFPQSYIQAILPEEGTYHSVDEDDQLDRFRLIEDKLFRTSDNRIVVFSNRECLQILDNNLTYLNIITEGIIQLIKVLKAKYGDVHLHVVIANRVDTTTGLKPAQSVVPKNEYINRLHERLVINGLEDAITEDTWELETQSARKDKRLMLADVICNTMFTRKRGWKFNRDERAYIAEVYDNADKTWVFTVLESVLEKEFRKNLLENRIGEAVAGICVLKDAAVLKRCFSTLRDRFATCGNQELLFQYKFIVAYIEYYINVVRDFDLCIRFLRNLLKYYIPILAEAWSGGSSLAPQLELDIKFYMMETYTHKGDVAKTEELIEECEELVKRLPVSFDAITYQIELEIRRMVHLTNLYDFERALIYANKQVENCIGIRDLMSVVSDKEDVHYDELAKALGTRVQIKTFLLRRNPELYDSAADDSDQAIKEFAARENDKRRQYSYRVQLETEHGNYDAALCYLKKSIGLPDNAGIKKTWDAAVKEGVFAVSAYIRLMAEASDAWGLSDEMYRQVSGSDFIAGIDPNERHYHPMEIILWKYGMYCAQHGQTKAGLKYCDMAIDACKMDMELTVNVIGLGIAMEEYAIVLQQQPKDADSYMRKLKKNWDKVQRADHRGILNSVFGETDFKSTVPAYYMALGRRVTY